MEIFSKKLTKFYRQIDLLTGKLEKIHAERLSCKKGCSACCVDGITVFEVEAENIRRRHGGLLENGAPREKGMCVFLDKTGACRIYENRPYVCRTQGLPLRWFDEWEDQMAEFRDICPLNEEGEAIENLPEEQCWTIGEFEAKLAALQTDFGDGRLTRISLRELFES